MSSLKHTDFMLQIAKTVGQYLQEPYQNFHLGETRWICQVYFGNEKRIHYEVSRLWNRNGRCLEIGLHLETRDSHFNRVALQGLDQYLIEIRASLGLSQIYADFWDKGWAKLYALHPDQELSTSLAEESAKELARFIQVVQPIFEGLT